MANFQSKRKMRCSLPFVFVSMLVYLLLFLMLTTCYTKLDQVPKEEPLLQFIYVYDILGSNFTHDLVKMPHAYHHRQYDGEVAIHEMLIMGKMAVTMDPEKATLFYVPYFPSHHLHTQFHKLNWKLQESLTVVSQTWANLLTAIRTTYPYFNRTNGRDHFGVQTMDHGRCSNLLFTDPSIYGEMFFLQLNGDILVRSTHVHTAVGMFAFTYNWGIKPAFPPNIPDIPCFIPGRDIMMPPIGATDNITSPFVERNIDVLLRFGPASGHDLRVHLPYMGRKVRYELLKLYQDKNISGWEVGLKYDTAWLESKFCVAPPGHSQWTSRPVESILAGCIPVIIESQHARPWEDELDYSKFSILIEIEDFNTMKNRIDAVLATPGLLKQMQQELQRVQSYFSWEEHLQHGAREQVIRELRAKARHFRLPKANQ